MNLEKKITALVLGATGACGKEIVYQLLDNPHCHKIILLSRKKFLVEHPNKNKISERIGPLENLTSLKYNALGKIHCIFSCLGTTRKQAGSAKRFRQVELHLNYQLATILRQYPIDHFSLISAKGANPKLFSYSHPLFHSFLYLKTKGELEEKIKKLNFKSLHIFRPGLLDRHGKDKRFSEKLLTKIVPSLDTKDLARVMTKEMFQEIEKKNPSKVTVYEDHDIKNLS